MGLEKLYEIYKTKPWMRDEVIAVFKGKGITLEEAIRILESGGPEAEELKQVLIKLGYDPVYQLTEEQWELALARWLAKKRVLPYYKEYYKGRLWTIDEIIREIRNRTPIGAEFATRELRFLEKQMM